MDESTINRENVESLYHGQTLYHVLNRNADSSPQRWRVNGAVKLWKTRPAHFRVPIKYGLWGFDYLTHDDAHLLRTTENAAMVEGED